MRDLALWQKQEYTGMKPGLGRIRAFLKETGNPQDRFPAVHVAGTNGKGSTARMLAAILQQAGFRTGLYISPHLLEINERIQVDGNNMEDRALAALARKYGKTAERCKLTFFEFMTGIAFHHFADQGVAMAVLETGLGGRYDATNVIRRPRVSIVTDVDYDHQQFLGDRLADIAGEKAGIIKRGCPVVSGVERPAAARVLRRVAKDKRAPLCEFGRDFFYDRNRIFWKKGYQEFSCRGLNIRLSLLGEHQAKNCALALAALEALRAQGMTVGQVAVKEALAGVRWPGRFDVRTVTKNGRERTFVLDGGHNPGAVRRFVRTWGASPFGKKKMNLIFGVLKDKDYRTVIRELARRATTVVLAPVQSPRALGTEAMAQEWKRFLPCDSVISADSFADAAAKTEGMDVVGVTGSLYLVGEALRYLEEAQ